MIGITPIQIYKGREAGPEVMAWNLQLHGVEADAIRFQFIYLDLTQTILSRKTKNCPPAFRRFAPMGRYHEQHGIQKQPKSLHTGRTDDYAGDCRAGFQRPIGGGRS